MEYKHLNKKTVFENEHLRVFQEELELPEGQKVCWSFIKGKSAASVLAVTDEDELIFVKQYRPAIKDHLLEIPAGILEDNEDPLEGALRELEEETGYKARSVVKICDYYTSPGISSSKMHIFLAKNLEKTSQNLDEDEFLEIIKIPKNEVKFSELEDGKTLLAYTYFMSNKDNF